MSSTGRALVAQAQPFMVEAIVRGLIKDEIIKGCEGEISSVPVCLEPNFHPIWDLRGDAAFREQPWAIEPAPASGDLVRLQVWVSPEQEFDWNRSELFVKQLQASSFRAGFEVAGNCEGVTVAFLSRCYDQPIITAAFQGEFELCELFPANADLLGGLFGEQWENALFRDYYPSPPYSSLLTRPPELQVSPLTPLITAMSRIEPPAVGLYQALFEAVRPEHNWHRNVEILLDFDYNLKLQSGFHQPQRYAHQAPSGDLRHLAWELENKAHNDKPFYALAFRVAVVGGGNKGETLLRSLSTFVGLFQHGGRPLNYVTERDYAGVLPSERNRDMFVLGLTYRPGFLVNSWELTGPVHIPPLSTREHRRIRMDRLERLPVRNPELHSGTWIGTCDYAGNTQRVCIPFEERKRSTHLIGRSGMGKSTVEEHMIMSDIEEGHGVAVLDPHGDLIERVLCLIPERHVEKTIYFDPGDPDWVLLWNPLKRTPGQDIGRMTNDVVQAIQSFVAGSGWGDRLEHILRNIIFSLIHLPKSTFADISDLLRKESDESKLMREQILKVVANENALQFWLHDYKKYRSDELSPPKNKLSKLLVSSGTVPLMLSQPESRLNFKEIMDEGKIPLVNLSTVGPMVREFLGCFVLSLLHLTALSRSNIPIEGRRQFHIHCDEVHRFVTDALEELIAETRKYMVSLSMAHQYMSQFGKRRTDALSSVGSTLIFNVNREDARHLTRDLQGQVEADDLISLERYEGIARIGNDIVRLKTRPPLPALNPNFRDRIIEESRRKYYKPAKEVQKWIGRRSERWGVRFSQASGESSGNPEGSLEEFVYDEF